jgi:uncharacterized protein (TIGR03663 family)
MRSRFTWILLLITVLMGGSFFRLWRLNDRPMHTDEAVHAEKFSALLEKGFYVYNPDEFHGPTLNYFTLISAFLRDEKNDKQISETTLRIVPAFFGIALTLTPLFFLKGSSRRAVIFSSILIAFSPAFVYYSRYYIQEMLLVFFTAVFLGSGWRYFQTRKLFWIILSGIAAGLMHATKETFIFSLLAAFLAGVFCLLQNRSFKPVKVPHILSAVAAMAVTSILFYSSFGTNPGGIIDSVSTYGVWLQRASGQSAHIHPWYYYLDLLTWLEFIEPITWNEDIIIALGAVGLILALFRRAASPDKHGFMRFFAIYTLALTIIYSVIPYKTPWCVLSFLYGMVILAGWIIDRMMVALQARWETICACLFILVFVIASPAAQSWFLNFNYASSPVNPYVYAHTSTDIFQMTEAVKKAALASNEDMEMPVYVIAAGGDYWPLPWYLRNHTQIGYWSEVDPSVCNIPVILANAQLEQELLGVLYSVPKPGQKNLYVPLFEKKLQLRPGVEWRGYIRQDLWDRMNTADLVEKKNEGLGANPLDKKQIENLVHFSHPAMNTTFEVFIQDTRGTYAGQAARAAFKEVDRLESLLSRFIQNSDIGRINALKPGQELIIDPDTFGCLQVAGQAWQLTDGAFDVTLGNIIEAWKSGDSQKALFLQVNRPSMKMLRLNTDGLTVTTTDAGVNLDLGGIAKGYAVDKIADVLNEWGIDKALIHGGASSVRALKKPLGKNGWPVTLTDPTNQQILARLQLEEEVFSCSGIEAGRHIINPFTGRPVTDRKACWVRMKENAALADALTTAGMIMPIDKIWNLPAKVPDLSLMVLADNHTEGVLKIGNWSDNE